MSRAHIKLFFRDESPIDAILDLQPNSMRCLCAGNAMLKANFAAGFFVVLAISPAMGQARGCQEASKPKAAPALCLKVSAEKRAISYAEAGTCAKATPPACVGSCESGTCRVTYDGNFKQVCTCAH